MKKAQSNKTIFPSAQSNDLRLFLANAQGKQQQSLNLLKMAHRLDAISTQMKTQQSNATVTNRIQEQKTYSLLVDEYRVEADSIFGHAIKVNIN